MTKVYLKVNGEQKPYEVEEITVKQFKNGMKLVKNIFEMLKGNGNLAEFVGFLANEKTDEEKSKQDLDVEFGVKLAESFNYLLEEFPEVAVEVLAVASNIDADIIDAQPLDALFDIFDAVVEVNDIEKLISRGKKSLAVTKAKWQIRKMTGADK